MATEFRDHSMKSSTQIKMMERIQKMKEKKGLPYKDYSHGCIPLRNQIMSVIRRRLLDPVYENKINKSDIRFIVNYFFRTSYNVVQIEASLNKGKEGETNSGLKQKGYLIKNDSNYEKGKEFDNFYQDIEEVNPYKDSINNQRRYIKDLIELNEHEEQEKREKEFNDNKLAEEESILQEERRVTENELLVRTDQDKVDDWMKKNKFVMYIEKFRDNPNIRVDDLHDLCFIKKLYLEEMGLPNNKIIRFLHTIEKLKVQLKII